MQQAHYNKAIKYWLLSGVFLITAMVVIGGITRLTGSGLSIVEWNIISGSIPPLNEAEWTIAFEKYKQFPEYQKLNFSMSLSGFKQIFWWEFLHRLLGRIIGLAFIFPFLFFLLKKQLSNQLLKRLVFVLILGIAQGLMGWIMVKSGLSDNPHVSHYRLAAHLCLALSLIGVILWTIADIVSVAQQQQRYSTNKLNSLAKVVLASIVLQIILGAFVAGLKAGFYYNTYPLMNGEVFPSYLEEHITWANFLDKGAVVQFIHRWVAIVVLFLILLLWNNSRHSAISSTSKRITLFLMLTGFLQVGLGIATLLLAVPVALGVLHQIVAVALFSFAVLAVHQLSVNPQTNISPEKAKIAAQHLKYANS
ncbi:COX15/CtaA family protein [Pontibacter silvestris]|uniref:COX15/CtaA family protein n=1 Tax=Pontibacter silvestris TaxID=2305183 RepID=A0ABW4WUQ8_9BACT|nr:COX15/CtaA family protein [Pontibacter silvestris]MCC9137028.1 COX15/CtaA family protein [Pontibacter silvestris]